VVVGLPGETDRHANHEVLALFREQYAPDVTPYER